MVNHTPHHSWQVFADGDFGLTENPVWDSSRQGLWFIDIPKKYVHFKMFEGALQSWKLPEEPGALWLDGDKVLVAAQYHVFCYNTADSCFDTYQKAPFHNSNMRFNDCAQALSGQIAIGTLIYDKSMPDATIFLYDSGRFYPLSIDANITTANGLGFSADGRQLFFADTFSRMIGVASIDNHQTVHTRTLWHKNEQLARPDGLLIHGDQLFFALFEGGCLMQLDKDGTEIATFPTPVLCPTKATIGGDKQQWVFLTSAGTVRSDEEQLQFPLSGKVLYAPIKLLEHV